ncbi:MAG: pyruvate formate lyase [Clostridiales bacterium]|nr:pyruvate formate lyase [Clostridiales bacterium]
MSGRIERLKKTIEELNAAGVRRTLFYPLAHESLLSTRGEGVELRRAKAQAYLLDHAPLAILPDELIAGSAVNFFPLCEGTPGPEEQRRMARNVLDKYLENRAERNRAERAGGIRTFEDSFTTKKSRWALMSRVYHDASISYDDLQALIRGMRTEYGPRLEAYEIGRELERAFKLDYGADVKREIDSLPWFAANHLSLNYGKMLADGFEKRLKDIRARAGEHPSGFHEAQLVVCGAASRFFARYGDFALTEAAKSPEPRARELVEIGLMLKRLSARPAETFREGVQFAWMLQVMMAILWGSALSFGRFDQYLFPLYERDVASGRMAREEAKEILRCFWLKVNEPRMRTVQSLTIGGISPDGRDAANALTGACLEVIAEMKLPYPNVGARVNRKNPAWYLDRIIDCVRAGAGQPMLMADEVWIENLKKLGYADECANDYYNMGCVEIMIPGRQPNWGVTEPIAFPMLFEDVFRRYKGRESELDSFGKFREAYFAVLSEHVEADYREALDRQADMPGKCFDPFASLLTDGCIESGLDMFQGGAELGTHWSFYAYGLGTAADAMAAIGRRVYEEKRFSLSELSGMLDANFEGFDDARRLLSTASHYGNDLDDVDRLAAEILRKFDDQVFSYNTPGGRDKYVSTLFGYFFHIYHGEITGATANGRLRGEPFSDSMGPSQGKDVSGPTRMLNSVLKLDHSRVTGGYALNVKLNPSVVRGNAGKRALAALVYAYLESGGPQVQVNFADAETLRQAKREPAKYRNVIVRIGGYCEYFVNLDSALQDEIITRTLHGL